MKISLYTDNSLRLLVFLAANPDGLPSIGEIAGRLGLSHNHLAKIAHDLRRAGYIEAVRGRGGGIRLARPAREITLGEVLRHTETFPGHLDPSSTAPANLTALFDQALLAHLRALDRYSPADLTVDANEAGAGSGNRVSPPV